MNDPGDLDLSVLLQNVVEIETLLYETNEFSIILLTDEEIEANLI